MIRSNFDLFFRSFSDLVNQQALDLLSGQYELPALSAKYTAKLQA